MHKLRKMFLSHHDLRHTIDSCKFDSIDVSERGFTRDIAKVSQTNLGIHGDGQANRSSWEVQTARSVGNYRIGGRTLRNSKSQTVNPKQVTRLGNGINLLRASAEEVPFNLQL